MHKAALLVVALTKCTVTTAAPVYPVNNTANLHRAVHAEENDPEKLHKQVVEDLKFQNLASTDEGILNAESTECSSIVIAHGANLKETVNWSLDQGANGLEMDIHFDESSGDPTHFKHGLPCDCTSPSGTKVTAPEDSMCRLDVEVCRGQTPARDMLEHIANHPKANQIVLLYMDSKIADLTKGDETRKTGGAALAKLLMETVFSSTSKFKGVLNFGCPDKSARAYLQSGVDTFNSIAPRIVEEGRVIFAYDQDRAFWQVKNGPNAVETIQRTIELGTPWRGYNNGISANLPDTFYDAMLAASCNYAKGVLSAAPGIWTIDKKSSMVEYIKWDVGAIMTNQPKTAIDAFGLFDRCLATNTWRPKKATSNKAVEWEECKNQATVCEKRIKKSMDKDAQKSTCERDGKCIFAVNTWGNDCQVKDQPCDQRVGKGMDRATQKNMCERDGKCIFAVNTWGNVCQVMDQPCGERIGKGMDKDTQTNMCERGGKCFFVISGSTNECQDMSAPCGSRIKKSMSKEWQVRSCERGGKCTHKTKFWGNECNDK